MLSMSSFHRCPATDFRVQINVKPTEGMRLILDLARKSDILIENLQPPHRHGADETRSDRKLAPLATLQHP